LQQCVVYQRAHHLRILADGNNRPTVARKQINPFRAASFRTDSILREVPARARLNLKICPLSSALKKFVQGLSMWSRFVSDKRAGVAPVFALAIVPIIGMVGAAVDYSRGNAARTAMQASLDATALMLSRDAANMTPGEVSSKATGFFNAQFNRPEVANPLVTATLSTPQQGSFVLDVKASGNVPTTFTRLIGQEKLNISSSAQVKWGVEKLELALDNTGSMANNGKLTQLKTAAHNLLTTLQTAAKQPGDVKVSIIPFDTTVKIGTGYKDEFWVDYTVKNIQKNSWTGCVMDRDQQNDVQDTTPVAGSVHTLYPATQCSGHLTTMMPLTDILDSTGWTNLNNKIDAMQASGNTNVTIGLEWGWHSLTPNLPLTEGSDPAPDKDKGIILLTDGTNTQNRWSSSESNIDARTALACTNAKAANIRIYTVRVIDGNATLLKNCASKPSMYFEVSHATQLNSVFSSIAQNLANLRIAK
jgi:Flp pilus assembly protein TadG